MASTYRGHLDHVERFGRELYATGWAWDPDRPSIPITVGIMSGDRCLVTVLADKRRIDLVKKKKGNGMHSFKRSHIGSGLSETEIRNLRIHPIGVRQAISQDDCLFMEGGGQQYEGRIDTLEIFGSTARVTGWLWDLRQPEARVEARILQNDQLLATITASGSLKDLCEAGKGDGRHGFSVVIDHAIPLEETGKLSLAVTSENCRVTQQNPYEIRVREEAHPEVAQILLFEALRCSERDEVDKAVVMLRKLLLLWPEHREAYNRLLTLLGYTQTSSKATGNLANRDKDKLDSYRWDLKVFNSLLAELDQRIGGAAPR